MNDSSVGLSLCLPDALAPHQACLFSNCRWDKTQRTGLAKASLEDGDVQTLVNGFGIATWTRWLNFNTPGLVVHLSQAARALDLVPRAHADFQLKAMVQDSRAWHPNDLVLILVALIPQNVNAHNTYLFYTYVGANKNNQLHAYELTKVNVFKEIHVGIIKVAGKNKNPTLSHLIRSQSSLSSTENPLCFGAHATPELRTMLDRQIEIGALLCHNLALEDSLGRRFGMPLAQTCVCSKLVMRRLLAANANPTFRWCDYSTQHPLYVQCPFQLTEQAVRMCAEHASFGRVSDHLMLQSAVHMVTALQLAFYLEMESTVDAFSYLSVLALSFQSQEFDPKALAALLVGVVNVLGDKWFRRLQIGSTTAMKLQGPTLAFLLLAWLGVYEGLGSVTDMVLSSRNKSNIEQCLHFLTGLNDL